jgi:hypothetical protein
MRQWWNARCWFSARCFVQFFEQFLVGDRVEVDCLAGGISLPGQGYGFGDRGTVLAKHKGNWLDPVSQYTVELDYPSDPPTQQISGKYLRRIRPEEEESIDHREFPLKARVVQRVYEEQPGDLEATAGGILLPRSNRELKFKTIHGAIVEKQKGKRKNEPDQYLVQWDASDAPSWHSEASLEEVSQEPS